MEILNMILMLAYFVGGYMSVRYLKHNLLGVEVEIYSNALKYHMSQIIWGVILGWATIPIALLHYFYKAGQYKLAGGLLVVIAVVVFFMSGNKDKTDYNTSKPPAHHKTTVSNEKPKPKPKEEIESHTAETKPQEQSVTNSGKEIFVGTYNDGTKGYILTDTIKRNADNFTCTVRAGRDQLHYRFDGQDYSNSEGYHGNIHDGKSPVALAIYNYCTNEASTVEPTGKHWIKDANDVYLWNPEPQDGERITWSGGYVQDGNYKFADGNGTVTWYLNGEVTQVDEGTFQHGQRQGRFFHKFPSGRIVQSNWNNGVEIP